VEHLPGRRFGLTRQGRQQFEKHGHHYVHPAFANQGKRAVEIEQHVADVRTRCEAGAEFNQAMKGTCRKHRLVSRIGFPQKSIMATISRGFKTSLPGQGRFSVLVYVIPVGKAKGNLLLHQPTMKSTCSQTSRRAFLRSTAAAAAGLAVLPGAPAEAASSPAARKPSIKLGLDNFSVRAMGWKAGQLIDYAASLQTVSLLITDLNAFEKFDDD